MDAAAYFESRLTASMDMMNATSDPCARKAHEGLVKGYRALVADHSRLAADDISTSPPQCEVRPFPKAE